MIAVLPGAKKLAAPTRQPRDAEFLHSLTLQLPRTGKTCMVDAFLDKNAGNLMYVSETGGLAVVPCKKDLPAPSRRSPRATATYSFDLKVRKASALDWEQVASHEAAVFRDTVTGCLIYLSETGAVAAVAEAK